ncbi:MAG: Lrp/AsnC family transcriptional regulator [Clostridia bacterium]|nr:Lrp/AsnC family transcriptional regulator [Clostridia bacterium]
MSRKERILHILEENSRLTSAEIAERLDLEENDVIVDLTEMIADKVIIGYSAIINWEKVDSEQEAPVEALIEVNITPQRTMGFDKIAERIYSFPQVKACYLMSGNYDLLVVMKAKTLKDVANFVFDKIAPMEAVVSTQTHFILRHYKQNGIIIKDLEDDSREAVIL